MRLGIALPNYGSLATPEALCRLAATAEEAGADSVWVSDHLVAPAHVTSSYPYARVEPDRPAPLGVIEEFYEPVVTLSVLAGRTATVGLGISAYVMPYRHPVVTAKQIATLDALSGGRVLLAVGVGWLREEFDALGVPFARRGRRTEEYLAICRALWSGEEAEYDGELIRLPSVRTGPRPTQRPHPPIWIAGNSPAAIRRAARIGDGWHAIDLSPEEVSTARSTLRAEAAASDRDPDAIALTLRTTVTPGGRSDRPFSGDADAIRRTRDAYEAAGVTYLVANARGARSTEDVAARMHAIVAALRT